ncbi:MAG: Cellulophaga phage phi17:2, partial [Bacteroidota bacterium]
MAKKKKVTNSSQESQTFESGFVTDVNDFHLPETAWTYARNAINNSRKGDLGKLSNEFSNVKCVDAPYVIIGALHIVNDEWLLFSTNDYQSEIGRFKEGTCEYTKLVNNGCLGFKKTHLIKGSVRPTFDCSYRAYWADSLNPDRTMDIQNIPWVQVCTDSNGSAPGGCITCVDKIDALGRKILDCDAIRLESFIKMPKLHLKASSSSGNIKNGSYFFQVYYLVNGIKKTDYSQMSNVVSVYSHENLNSSLELTIENLDENFQQYEVVVTSTIADKTTSKILGQYSTNQSTITIDFLSPELSSITNELELSLTTPVADKSDGIYENGDYLMRVGPTEKFDFNYQPLANQIQSFWQLVEYPDDYYKKGGTNVGYMRDENYPFFIRFIYKTGDRTSSFHIPGRAAVNYTLPTDSASAGSAVMENAACPGTPNIIENGYTPKVFEVYNTAWVTSFLNVPTADGGTVVAEGRMGYHESTEFYDDKHPERWNASAHPWSQVNASNASDFDLCGKPIRHHKFPENTIGIGFNNLTNHYVPGSKKIRVMGVSFKNIKAPVDNNGKPIKNIVGYEILRGSRNG